MSDDQFSAVIDALQRGGLDLSALGKSVEECRQNLAGVVEGESAALGDGSDMLSAQIRTTVVPALGFACDLFDGLAGLMGGHGSKAVELGTVFDNTNSGATEYTRHG